MLTEKLVQYHSLLGHSRCYLSTEMIRICYLVYSPHWDKPRLPYLIGSIRELPPYWIIPGFYYVDKWENTLLSHVVHIGTSPAKINKTDWIWPTNLWSRMPSHSP